MCVNLSLSMGGNIKSFRWIYKNLQQPQQEGAENNSKEKCSCLLVPQHQIYLRLQLPYDRSFYVVVNRAGAKSLKVLTHDLHVVNIYMKGFNFLGREGNFAGVKASK